MFNVQNGISNVQNILHSILNAFANGYRYPKAKSLF